MAQLNSTILYTDHFDLQASRYQPTKLGTGTANVNLALPLIGFNSWLGNNAISVTKALDVKEGKVTLNSAISRFPKNVIFGSAIAIDIFGISLRFNKKKPSVAPPTETPQDSLIKDSPDTRSSEINVLDTLKKDIPLIKRHREYKPPREENFTVSAGIALRNEANVLLSRTLFEFIANGNAGFVGKTVDVGRFNFNFSSFAEIYAGFAKNIVNTDDMKIRIAARPKYLIGILGVHTQRGKGEMTIAADTSEIRFNADYRINEANFNDGVSNSQNYGRGFGIDIGGSVVLKDKIVLSGSFLDIGGIHYKKNVRNYNGAGMASFQGVNVSARGIQNAGNVLDSLQKSFRGSETQEAFTMPMPTRLVLQGEYRIPQETSKGRIFYKHHFFATYIQGLRNLGSATTTPQITLGYVHSLGTAFQVGVTPTFGGFVGAGMGAFFSWRVSGLRLAVGSSDIISLATLGGRLFDASIYLGFGF
ncbi:MAG: DUF5723 family protein [Microscillaceae bacterium]|nr:DUF5723 family protein [Microscillaceae bacterium]MDW8460143.1 DUF5723 family protein [Cytophagales bacterium]